MRRFVFACAWLLSSATAFAQDGAFSFSGGYSHLYTDKRGGLSFANDGGYFDGDILWRIRGLDVPLQLGVGISGTGYYQYDHIYLLVDPNYYERYRLESDVGLFSLEARAAVPIGFRSAPGLFVEPRIGAGLLVDEYSIDRAQTISGVTYLDTIDHSGAAFAIRPALRAGYSWGPGAVGAEVSYMAAWGDFGRLGRNAQELRAGVFLRFRF